MIDTDNNTLRKVRDFFSRVDHLSHVLVWGENKKDQKKIGDAIQSVELSRLQITFNVVYVNKETRRLSSPDIGDKYIVNKNQRFSSPDLGDKYIINENQISEELAHLISGIPHGILLQVFCYHS